MRSILLALLLLPTLAGASGRYQLLGASATHLMVREIYSRSQCCGAEEVVDCKYPGVAALAGRLDRLTSPKKGVPVPDGFTGVRIHVLPYHAGELLEIPEPGKGEMKTFTIYESVTSAAACTSAEKSATALADAKKYARSVGVDVDAPWNPSPTAGAPVVLPEDCLRARAKPACTSEEGEVHWFAIGDTSEGRTLRLFVETRPRQWGEVAFYRNAMVWLAPALAYNNDRIQARQFRLFASQMGETWEYPVFLIKSL